MDIAPFYELRSRLYATAAAGCSVIEEDFRLKRAVEAFAPLAQANRAFGQLYTLCGQLFTTENTAQKLADCIALADALAVVQGGYQDSSQTEESQVDTGALAVPVKVPHSKVSEVIDAVRKVSQKLLELSPEQLEAVYDPRVLAAFIDVSGTSSIYLEKFAALMFSVYGESLISLWKQKLEATVFPHSSEPAGSSAPVDGKASGAQVAYVSRYAGAQENDWYLSLVERTAENGPVNVRIRAVLALGKSPENAGKLIELFQTEKAKVKSAAVLALAELNPPEAEPIWKKLTENYKDSYQEYITASSSRICSDFVRKEIHQANGQDYPFVPMLANKTDVEDCFLYLADRSSTYFDRIQWHSHLCSVLLGNLQRHSEPEYEAMIHRLYEAKPETFYLAELYLVLLGKGSTAFGSLSEEMAKHPEETMLLLQRISYSRLTGKYETTLMATGKGPNMMTSVSLVLFDRIPPEVIAFLTDIDYIESLQQMAERHGQNTCEALSQLLHTCPPDDYQLLETVAVKYALYISKKCSNMRALNVIQKFYRNGSSADYVGITSNYVLSRVKMGYYTSFDFIDEFPMSQEDKINELQQLLAQLLKMKKEAGIVEATGNTQTVTGANPSNAAKNARIKTTLDLQINKIQQYLSVYNR